MAYDPYQSGEEQSATTSSIIGDMIRSPFLPSTYLWSHTHMPGMWNTQKGVVTPWGMKQSISAKNVATSFRSNGFRAGMKTLWGEKGTLNPYSMMMGMYGKNKQYIGKTLLKGKITKKTKDFIFREEYYKSVQSASKNFMKNNLPEGTYTSQQINRLSRASAVQASKILKENGSVALNRYKLGTTWHMLDAQAYEGATVNAASRIKGLAKTARRTAIAAKWGVRLGKTVSTIGLLMTAWEVSQMVFQPLGAAAVNLASRTADEWSQRFMPEMGGQLSMAYLSQGAATERQKAVQAMGKAQINGRSAFGQEALYNHQ